MLPAAFCQVFFDELSAGGQRLLLGQVLQQRLLSPLLLPGKPQSVINLDLGLQELFAVGMFGNQLLDKGQGGQKLARLDIEIEQLQLDLVRFRRYLLDSEQVLLGLRELIGCRKGAG